ncbi:hypothetical protein DFH07DRAFT_773847 [Mycena maculata]|uniref:Uncharacterized protein n=1 Tax=Mycena maculata TaxID=230809 RepID=A0AAD7NBV4_9AGAR|nr:hypothetical protein DFH07DRAFT_773847 [Mycena maculata]
MLLELAVSVLTTLAFHMLFSFHWEIPVPLRSLPGDLKDDIALGRHENVLGGTASSSATLSLPPEIWLHFHRMATSESSPLAKASADHFQYEPIRDPLKDMQDFLRLMNSVNPDKSRCSSCKTWKPATTEFFDIKLGKCPGTCRVCKQKKAEKRKKATEGTASGGSYPTDDDDTNEELSDLSRFTLEEYLTVIAMDKTARSFSALVDTEVLDLKG